MPSPAPAMPSIPVQEVMSFLKETRSALTWNQQEMAESLNISPAEAIRVIDLLAFQGYVKRSSMDKKWMTTIDGETVSGSKSPRFAQGRVEKALGELKDRIMAVNRDRRAILRVTDAVAFGDFLLEIPRVQAAEVGILFVARTQSATSYNSANDERQLIRLLRGKGGILQLKSYQPWMTRRSHRRLL
jgi:hypothetical protein